MMKTWIKYGLISAVIMLISLISSGLDKVLYPILGGSGLYFFIVSILSILTIPLILVFIIVLPLISFFPILAYIFPFHCIDASCKPETLSYFSVSLLFF